MVENQLNQMMHSHRTRVAKIKNEYNMELSVARNRWLKQKAEHDARRMSKLLPTKWGRHPIGSSITQSLINREQPGSPAHVIGMCVADLVDAVIIKTTNPTMKDESFPPFNPPPVPDVNGSVVDPNTGETYGQMQQRMQSTLQKEITTYSVKLNASEEERKRAWKKWTKAKSELMPHTQQQAMVSTSSVVSAQANPTQYTQYAQHSAQAYASSTGGASDSKYSAARIKARSSTDGTVAPVSTPKVTREGLYVRPAGRKRKGMDWDSVRGIWVPSSNGYGRFYFLSKSLHRLTLKLAAFSNKSLPPPVLVHSRW